MSRARTRPERARIGRGAAAAVCGSALVVGLVTGRFLLPDRPGSEGASPSAAPPTTSAAARATFATTPPTEANLVPVAAFDRAGLSVEVYPENGNTSPGSSLSACTDERTVGARTLGDVTGHDPLLLGAWEEPSTTDTATEVVGMAGAAQAGEVAAARLLAAHTTCQTQPVGRWVYGRTHRQTLAPGVWAAWLGLHPGSQNTTGQAPDATPSCGGVAVLRNGRRFALLEVYLCTDTDQLRTLALAGAARLG